MGVSEVSQRCFEEVSGIVSRCFKYISRVFLSTQLPEQRGSYLFKYRARYLHIILYLIELYRNLRKYSFIIYVNFEFENLFQKVESQFYKLIIFNDIFCNLN